jgi:TetR/AcrR family transcriptional regulator
LIGDALVHENERLQTRINQLHDRVEATLKQAIRFGASQNELPADIDAAARANLIMSCVSGRWQQFAKSGFKRDPMQYWPEQWRTLISH